MRSENRKTWNTGEIGPSERHLELSIPGDKKRPCGRRKDQQKGERKKQLHEVTPPFNDHILI
jgi:hypothetical protein